MDHDAARDAVGRIRLRLDEIDGELDTVLDSLEPEPGPDPEPGPELPGVENLQAKQSAPNKVRVWWATRREDITGWTVARDGTDTGGYGAWSGEKPASPPDVTFDLLRQGVEYTFTITPHTAAGDLPSASVKATLAGAPVPTPEPEPGPGPAPDTGGDGVTAAATLGWGAPVWRDEMDYTGPPDPAKWNNAPAGGMPGHAGNGRRIASSTYVRDGMMVLHGKQNGDTGWCRQALRTRYGRWEIRVRSRNLGGSGALYHVLALIWPTSEQWPEGGEYDWVEYFNPDSQKLSCFQHYPHNPGPVQQEYAETPADMGEWQNVAFEWTADGLTGYLNGRRWYRFSGGASGSRRNIQDMPEGYLTLQLDNFHGSGMREAVMEVAWVRFYRP